VVLACAVVWTAVRAEAAIWRVPLDVPSIGAAIDSSGPGDVIRVVGNGGSTYPERLLVDRDVTIEGGWRADFLVRDPDLYVSVIRDTTGLFQRSVIRVEGPYRLELDGIWVVGGRVGVEAAREADVVLRDCKFQGQRNTKLGFGDQPGGAVHMTGGNLLMERTRVRDIFTIFPGGGVGLVDVESATLRDCSFDSTRTSPRPSTFAPAPGGAIYATGMQQLILERVGFVGCAAAVDDGGAIFARDCDDIQMLACTFLRNTSSLPTSSDGGAGGIHLLDCGSIRVDGSLFRYNLGRTGGGLLVSGAAQLRIENTRIESNSASADGSGLWLERTPFELRNVTFLSNHTTLTFPVRGGAVRSLGSSGLVENTSFTGERVSGNGGAWHQLGGTVTFRQCSFVGNEAAFFGGATHIELAGTIRLERCLLVGNTAKFGGASSASFTGALEIDHTTMSGNRARSAGAAVYVDTSGRALVTDSILCCALQGELVYCSAGVVEVSFSDVWNDDAVNIRREYGGVCPDATGTNGNIKAAPAFCPSPEFTLSTGSPCAGTASDGTNMGWADTGCPLPLLLEEESWGRIKARYGGPAPPGGGGR